MVLQQSGVVRTDYRELIYKGDQCSIINNSGYTLDVLVQHTTLVRQQ